MTSGTKRVAEGTLIEPAAPSAEISKVPDAPLIVTYEPNAIARFEPDTVTTPGAVCANAKRPLSDCPATVSVTSAVEPAVILNRLANGAAVSLWIATTTGTGPSASPGSESDAVKAREASSSSGARCTVALPVAVTSPPARLARPLAIATSMAPEPASVKVKSPLSCWPRTFRATPVPRSRVPMATSSVRLVPPIVRDRVTWAIPVLRSSSRTPDRVTPVMPSSAAAPWAWRAYVPSAASSRMNAAPVT